MKQDETIRRPRSVHAWLALWRAAKGVEAQARQSVAATGLCLSDFGVLEALLHLGPLSVGELGRRVLLTSGSITASVDRLQGEGLVERAPSLEDRRARVVHLTEPGRTLIRQHFAVHEQDMARAFELFTDAELATLASLLSRLARTARPTDKQLAPDGAEDPGGVS